MAISFKDWVYAEEEGLLESQEGTVGGTTYSLDGTLCCYNFTKSHYRAVRALTDDASNQYEDIQDGFVDQLVAMENVRIDDSDCWDGYGWLGCKVWDGQTGEFIGTIGTRCALTAGFGTEHVGTGRCKLHGGAKIGNRVLGNIKHGLTSKYLRKVVEDKVSTYMADPAPLDLSREIAMSRALFEMLVDFILDQGDIEQFMDKVPGLLSLIDNTGRLVDRAAMIEKRYAMTAAQVLYVQSVFVDILNRYILDPGTREMIASELARRLGTSGHDVNLALHPALDVGGNGR